MDTTTSETTSNRPWSTSATIAAALREGATLTAERGGVFVLTLASGEQLRAGRLDDLAQHLRLVAKRPPRKPAITFCLSKAVLDNLAIVLDKGETVTSMCRAAVRAEVQRRRADLALDGADPADDDHDNERAALLLRIAELQRALELPR